jgi:hypothetical protein
MATASTLEIRIVATGAEQASAVLKSVEQAGARIGNVTAAGAKQAEKAIDDLGKQLTEVNVLFETAGVNTGIFGRAVAALATPLGLAAVAVGGLGAALVSVTKAAIDNAKEIKSLMAVSGLNAEEADNLANTFQLLGSDVGALTNALFKMGTELDSGGAGLRKIGLTLADVQRATSEGELFLMVRDRIAAMGTAAERSAALMAVFGRAGRELAPIFAMSREKFIAFMEEAEKLSPWSQKSQEETEKLIRAINAQSMAWAGLKMRIAELTTPTVTEGLKAITGFLQRGHFMGPAPKSAGASGTWDMPMFGPPDPGPQFAEQRAELAVIAAQKQAARVIAVLGLEEAARKQAVELGLKSEQTAAAERIKTVDLELAAKKSVFAAELKAAQEKDDLLGTKAAAVQAKIVQAEQEAAVKRAEIQNDLVRKSIAAQDAIGASRAKEGEDLARSQMEAQAISEQMRADKIKTDLEEEAAALEANNAGWVAHAEAILAATEAEQLAIAKIEELKASPLKDLDTALRSADEAAKLFGTSLSGVGGGVDVTSLKIEALRTAITRLINEQGLEAAGDKIRELKGRLDELQRDQRLENTVRGIGDAFQNAMSTSVQAVILGTSKISDAFRNLAQSVAISLLDQGVKGIIKAAMDALTDFLKWLAQTGLIKQGVGLVVSAVGGFFGGGNTGFTGSAAGNAGSLSDTVRGLPGAAEGAFIRARPGGVAVMVGEGGQDEVIMPLDKLNDVTGSGGFTIIVRNETGVEAEGSARETTGPDGERALEIRLKRMMQGAMVDGSMDSTMRQVWGMTRHGVRR